MAGRGKQLTLLQGPNWGRGGWPSCLTFFESIEISKKKSAFRSFMLSQLTCTSTSTDTYLAPLDLIFQLIEERFLFFLPSVALLVSFFHCISSHFLVRWLRPQIVLLTKPFSKIRTMTRKSTKINLLVNADGQLADCRDERVNHALTKKERREWENGTTSVTTVEITKAFNESIWETNLSAKAIRTLRLNSIPLKIKGE